MMKKTPFPLSSVLGSCLRTLPHLLVIFAFLPVSLALELPEPPGLPPPRTPPVFVPIPPPEAAVPVADDGTAHFLAEKKQQQRAHWVTRLDAERRWLTDLLAQKKELALTQGQETALRADAEAAIEQAYREWSTAADLIGADLRNDKNHENQALLTFFEDSWDMVTLSRLYPKLSPSFVAACLV